MRENTIQLRLLRKLRLNIGQMHFDQIISQSKNKSNTKYNFFFVLSFLKN